MTGSSSPRSYSWLLYCKHPLSSGLYAIATKSESRFKTTAAYSFSSMFTCLTILYRLAVGCRAGIAFQNRETRCHKFVVWKFVFVLMSVENKRTNEIFPRIWAIAKTSSPSRRRLAWHKLDFHLLFAFSPRRKQISVVKIFPAFGTLSRRAVFFKTIRVCDDCAVESFSVEMLKIFSFFLRHRRCGKNKRRQKVSQIRRRSESRARKHC